MNEKLNNYIEKINSLNCFSHAYLIEVDDSYNSSIAIGFAKNLITSINNKIINQEKIQSIDEMSFDNLKVIRPDGKFIKKEQLLNLMSEYKTKSVSSIVRVYIIEFAENLNNSSANTILKFLEEPEEGIIAILVTKNKYSVIETIVSRCQVLNIVNRVERNFDDNMYDYSVELLKLLISKKEKAIAYLTDVYSFNSDQIGKVLTNLSIFYENVVNAYYDVENQKREEQFLISDLISGITVEEALNKLNKIDKSLRLLDYNVNPRIALDILFCKEDTDDRSL